MTNTMQTTKLNRVENLDTEMLQKGIIAFQLVKLTYSFYGVDMSEIYDTKIMQDGRQYVIDGDGFIKAGFEIINN